MNRHLLRIEKQVKYQFLSDKEKCQNSKFKECGYVLGDSEWYMMDNTGALAIFNPNYECPGKIPSFFFDITFDDYFAAYIFFLMREEAAV